MRGLAFVIALLIAQAASVQSFAATHSTSFTVSSMVEAPCAINTTSLLAHPEAAVGSVTSVCASAGRSSITAQPARILRANDDITGRSMLMVEF